MSWPMICSHVAIRPDRPSAFVIDYPKKREVFAALFRDRIVHHLYFNYTHTLFERTFIQDSYSCIKGRGTHYGIQRLAMHIRQESQNWTVPCYAMNLDIRGYFMHIQRDRLLRFATSTIRKMADHRISCHSPETWGDKIDIDFICWLTEQIVMLDPKTSCEIIGFKEDWIGMDPGKSLFHTPDGCGLPIGNLTSQLFSNVYLNEFDQFMKRTLGARHYGRYVDDSYVISSDRDWLLAIVPEIRRFLQEHLGLELHMGKLHVRDIREGVEFLGAFVKPWRIYVSNKTLARIRKNLRALDLRDVDHVSNSVNSYLGVLSHNATYNLRCNLFLDSDISRMLEYDPHVLKSKPASDKQHSNRQHFNWKKI